MTVTRNGTQRTERPPIRLLEVPDGETSGSAIAARFRDDILDAVREHGVAVVRGFPTDGAQLVEFGRSFGPLEPADPFKAHQSPDDPADWLGHTKAHKKKTWGDYLRLHTAAAHAQVEPTFQVMLMMDKGVEPPDDEVDNGQSTMGRVDDAVRRLVANVGQDRADEVLQILQTVPVSTEFPFPDEPRNEPLLVRRADGSWHFRYWIHVLEHAKSQGWTQAQLDALYAFEEALQQVMFQFALNTGDLIVLDNQRIAHGRRPFPKQITDETGATVPTTRKIWSIHVFCEL
jgi:alpha-ketoglutarate-dependent taurine dioxygenase